jgi:hypothetical protein
MAATTRVAFVENALRSCAALLLTRLFAGCGPEGPGIDLAIVGISIVDVDAGASQRREDLP